MSSNDDNVCIVCFKNVTIYSIGQCEHSVCYECSTRMRVLCRQNECPICRQELQTVVFTNNIKPFEKFNNRSHLTDRKYNIQFVSHEIQKAFLRLLEHRCCHCPNRPLFANFDSLKDHMRRDHDRLYCDLCVENLKIFTSERRCYTKQDLSHHRKKGDLDDKSHKGHPLCEFCNERYMDNDDLYRHLRREHLFCHFCDADGKHLYYSSYDLLRDHFRADHFLCEEGSCVREQFTSAFRTDIDLKAHRALEHGKALGKSATRQARTLELEFTLKPRARPTDQGNRRGNASREYQSPREQSPAPVPTEPTPPDLINDFPSLSASNSTTQSAIPLTNIQPSSQSLRKQIRGGYEENFPSLGGNNGGEEGGGSGVSVRLGGIAYSSLMRGDNKAEVQVNIQKNKKSEAGPSNVSIHVSRNKKDEFPALARKKEEDIPSLAARINSNLSLRTNEPIRTDFVCLNKPASPKNKKKKKSAFKNPPPGFAPANGSRLPPPGFHLPSTNGLTFTNSQGEQFAINSPYVKPENFSERNSKLVTEMQKVFGRHFEEFRENSALFRKGLISAEGYYDHCRDKFGVKIELLLPELIVLLPDVQKQRELYGVLAREGVSANLHVCPKCQQILAEGDFGWHAAYHFTN